jgi:cytoskeletal protein RodZ
VRAIEWERFDLLPSSRDAREYIRSYAELLGLDAGPYVDHYDSVFAREQPPERARLRRRAVLTALLAVAVLAAVGVVAAWQLLRDESDEARTPAPMSPSRARPGSEAANPAQTRPPARRTTSVAGKKVARPTRVVVVAVRGDSWIEARSGDAAGAVLYRGNLQHGRSLRLRARRLWMRLGAASNLDVTLNGRKAGRSLFGTVDVRFDPRTASLDKSRRAAP